MKIKDLKKELKGNVLRRNKYLLELYVPGEESRPLQILCQSVNLPVRSIDVVTIHHKGRPFLMRGETNFGTNISLTFLENQESEVRRMMDFWLQRVDNPELHKQGQEDSESGFQGLVKKTTKEINQQVSQVKDIKSVYKDLNQVIDFQMNSEQLNQYPQYQTNVRIWQLDHNGDKVYGYELQNQFISGVGEGDFNATQNNEYQTVQVTLSYSEVLALQGDVLSTVGKVLGTDVQNTQQRVKSLF